jgi:hypothetical protein
VIALLPSIDTLIPFTSLSVAVPATVDTNVGVAPEMEIPAAAAYRARMNCHSVCPEGALLSSQIGTGVFHY